jgi:hypothetical protein
MAESSQINHPPSETEGRRPDVLDAHQMAIQDLRESEALNRLMAERMTEGVVPGAYPPFDEPLGLGHSLEAVQLQLDATRIMVYEVKVADVNDPWAGSYFMESLTDREAAAAAAHRLPGRQRMDDDPVYSEKQRCVKHRSA